MASALPAENIVARTTPGEDAQNQCSATQKAQCCNSVTEQIVAGIPVNVGLNCVDIDVISVLPLASQCSQSQKVVCCQQVCALFHLLQPVPCLQTLQQGLVNVCTAIL
ncbi:MAG: hypothetical protein Q9171_000214 [Xanthocarpia ochracea]